jgi:hypothetical protein
MSSANSSCVIAGIFTGALWLKVSLPAKAAEAKQEIEGVADGHR